MVVPFNFKPDRRKTNSDNDGYTPYNQGMEAATRLAFADEFVGTTMVDLAVSGMVNEHVQKSEKYNEYKRDAQRSRLNSMLRGLGMPPDPEAYLKTYSRKEFADMGYTVPENLSFDRTRKTVDGSEEECLTLPRLQVYLEHYEQRQKDQELVANMRPGLGTVLGRGAAGLLAASIDPMMLLPGGAWIKTAKGVAKGVSFLSKAKAVAKTGLVTGGAAAAGTAVSDAVNFPRANRTGADLGMEEAMVDTAMAGAFGSALGLAGPVLDLIGRLSLLTPMLDESIASIAAASAT